MTETERPSTPCGGGRPEARGKFLYVSGRKLLLRGVTYGTFRPGPFGEAYPPPPVVRADVAGMRRAGFNALRTYTVPPEWLLDEAGEAGLRVLVGIPWEQHVAFLDTPELPPRIRKTVRDGVERCREHQAVLGYALGNEIPAPVVRWSGRRRVEEHLRRLYETAKEADPAGLVTYANYPSTEYLELPFLDFLSVNVFLESTPRLAAYLARLQTLADDRPLVVSELGLDSLRNGPTEQARLLSEQVRAVEAGGCAGSFTFAWTDEWHRGGRDVDDWAFGLTTVNRRPKPALAALSEAFQRPGPEPESPVPSVSVVVCCYNSADTLADCLEGIGALEYPAYEVIVVDDGSTDGTATIASRYDVRLIRTENRGLSRARNTGIEAARGEIVAFIDSDARPDPDWLTHLALAFEASDFVGVGGPNIAPPGDGLVAACVAEAPGGPIHVLRTDREAEHIPGCNMAFRRAALLEIGGFDPQFRVAGDDVDLCWRLHARGWRIGFAPGAVVWHHARNSVRGYWKQQSGYGVAEALLEAKWPEKYNVAGHVTWGGRVYGPGTLRLPFRRGRVYQGTWGRAPFQQREEPTPNLLWEAVAMPEWYLIIAALAGLALLGLSWSPLLLAGALAAFCMALTVARAVVGARSARFDRRLGGPRERMTFRALALGLHLVQPLARLQGRWLRGLVPWRSRARSRRVLWPRQRQLRFWRGASPNPAASMLEHVEAALRQEGCVVRRDGGYEDWDLEVEGGALGASRLRSLTEWHEEGQRLVRFSVEPRTRGLAWVVVVTTGCLGLWGLGAGATVAGLLLVGAAAFAALRASWEAGTTSAALCDAICVAVERDHTAGAGVRGTPDAESHGESGTTPRRDGPVWLPAAG